MQKLKSYFPVPFFTLAGVVLIYASYQIVSLGLDTAHIWFGVLLSALPSNIFVLGLLSHQFATTRFHLPVTQAVTYIGVIATLAFSLLESTNLLAVGLSVAMAIGLLLYIYWYSKFDNVASNKLTVGQALPDFDIYTTEGDKVAFASLQQDPALLIFFRGNWCPLCVVQVREVAESYQELKKRGVSVYLIGSQHEQHTIELAKKFDAPMTFLSDKNQQAGHALDIIDPNGTPRGMDMLGYNSDTLLPTVILTDRQGKIVMLEQTDSYRVRPEPQDFLAAYDRLVK